MNKEWLNVFKQKAQPEVEVHDRIVPIDPDAAYTPLNNPPTDILVVKKVGDAPFGFVKLEFDRVYYDLEIQRTFIQRNIDAGITLHEDVRKGLIRTEQKLRKEERDRVDEARINRAKTLRALKKNK